MRSKKKPIDILLYNQYMGAVDQNDQKVSYYECLRKTTRWPIKGFLRILDYWIVNAHEFYKLENPNQQSFALLHFRLCIIDNLLRNFKSSTELELAPRSSTHQPTLIIRNSEGIQLKRRCIVCSKPNHSLYGSYECRACPRNKRSGLFPAYHLRCYHVLHQ